MGQGLLVALERVEGRHQPAERGGADQVDGQLEAAPVAARRARVSVSLP